MRHQTNDVEVMAAEVGAKGRTAAAGKGNRRLDAAKDNEQTGSKSANVCGHLSASGERMDIVRSGESRAVDCTYVRFASGPWTCALLHRLRWPSSSGF